MNGKLTPIDANERILALDVLRGLALFGILVVNMKFFATPTLFLDMGGIELWTDTPNKLFKVIIQLFFEFKFVTMFSFIFGLGFMIFISRANKKGVNASKLFKRRLSFLLLIGLVHLFFVWYGDILTVYTILGFLLLFFINKSEKSLLKWAFGLVGVPVLFFTLLSVLMFMFMGQDQVEPQDQTFLIDQVDHVTSIYRDGSIVEIFKQRLFDISIIYVGNLFLLMPLAFAMFLLGMYTWKRGIIQNIRLHLLLIKRISIISFIIGVPFSLLSLWAGFNIDSPDSPYYFVQYLSLGISGPALSLFYITAIILLLQKEWWKTKLQIFQPMGKMALTNYLSQSLICTTLFYSYGFGLFGSFDYKYMFLLSIVIYLIQVIVSHYWFKKYRYGPLEKVWRNYTYKKVRSIETPLEKISSQ